MRYLVLLLGLAGTYFAAARLGLSLALEADQVSVVWPPTGVTLAAAMLWGLRIWPAIALGALLANLQTGAPLTVSLGIATGNTLEAVCGAWLLRSMLDVRPSLERMRDAVGFILVGAMLCIAISASLGVFSLCAGHLQPWTRFPVLWSFWWLGDAVGALVVAPFILCCTGATFRGLTRQRLAEAILLLLLLISGCLVVFTGWFGRGISSQPLEYVIFPLVIWSAMRFNQLMTSLLTIVASAIAIVGTFEEAGPFAIGNVHQGLVLLQSYMLIVAATGLLLSAAVKERAVTERRRAAAYEVAQYLASSASLREAAPKILQAMCDGLGWDIGAIWVRDRKDDALRCLDIFHRPGVQAPSFIGMSRDFCFRRGIGLPGRIWDSAQPAWLPDVTVDRNFPRASTAASENLHGAFGFPIVVRQEVVGVVEFFSRVVRQPDIDLLSLAASVGAQIGLFIERTETETALRIADRKKDEFLATLAHELRNPLAPISNALQFLTATQESPRDANQLHELMNRHVKQLVRLIDDLLDVSRITRNKIELRTACIDLGLALDDAIEMARPLIDSLGHCLTVDRTGQELLINADRTRVVQVITNLLNNAAKFMPVGGLIEVSLQREANEAVLKVRDHGRGIPPDLLPHIFELFVQADASVARAHSGLGIGLSLANTLVELHGGTLTAHSEGENRGSEFRVTFPTTVRSTANASMADEQPAPAGALETYQILVVDDIHASGQTLALMLQAIGQQVTVVNNGPAALEALAAGQYDFAFIDIAMPGMTGYDVARAVRLSPARNGLVLVALTGYGQESDRQQAFASGFDHHMTKPTSITALREILSRASHSPASC